MVQLLMKVNQKIYFKKHGRENLEEVFFKTCKELKMNFIRMYGLFLRHFFFNN